MLVCQKVKHSDKPINVGSNNEISIKDLAEKILTLTKKQSGNLIKDLNRVRPEDSEVMQLKCNNNKLIQNTNWKPKYSLENGLIETVDWFKKNMKISSVNKINKYFLLVELKLFIYI